MQLIKNKEAFIMSIGQNNVYNERVTKVPELRYRIAVLVRSPVNPDCHTIGLIDTGANASAISLSGLQALRISNPINTTNNQARGVDGHVLPVIGDLSTSIFVGKFKYNGKFAVLKMMHDYDFILGTDFLYDSGILPSITRAVEEKVGAQFTATDDLINLHEDF